MIGRTLSHYKILSEISRGGMGIVYRAVDVKLDREVALKVLPPELVADPERKRRFVQEAKAAAKLEHPHIGMVFEIDEVDGVSFIAMELIRGEQLRDTIAKGPLRLRRALEIATDIAEGLSKAHDEGIVHRDLKPANIMVTEDGHTKIIDFGLAKLVEPLAGEGSDIETLTRGGTDPGKIMGTVSYMSPEQARGTKVDHRSDIFSFGIVFHEMITGHIPFKGDSAVETLNAILKELTPRFPLLGPEVSVESSYELQHILDKCLAKEPADRYQGAEELVVDLRSARRRLESGPLTTPQNQARAGSWIYVCAFAATVLLTAGIAWMILQQPQEEDALSTTLPTRPSIAVLYFENASGDSELDWLRDGLTDMLVTDLSQSPNLDVLSMEQLYQILNDMDRLEEPIASLEDLKELAQRANTQTAIVGSFMKAGENIRINIRVQDPESGEIQSTEKVEGVGESSIFSMVDELTRRIKTRLEPARVAENDIDQDLVDVTTSSVDAYRFYVQAKRLEYEGAWDQSIPLYEKALETDPEFATAMNTLSVMLGNVGSRRESEQYTERAFERRHRLPARERLYIEGIYHTVKEETYAQGISAFEKAVELYPNDLDSRHDLAWTYLRMERFDEAKAHLEVLLQMETPDVASYGQYAECIAYLGQFDVGHDAIRKYLERHPKNAAAYWNLGIHLTRWGKLDEALEAFEIAESLGHLRRLIDRYRWHTFVLLEQWEEAESTARRESTSEGGLSGGLQRLALTHLFRGRRERALEHLKQMSSANGYYYAAQIFLEQGRATLALEQANAVQQAGMGNSTEWRGLQLAAIVRARLGQFDQADATAEELRRKTQSIPTEKEKRRYFHTVGEIELARGDTSLAVVSLVRAESMLPQRGGTCCPGSQHVLIWFSLASAYLADGNEEQACRWFQHITKSGIEHVGWPIPYVRSFYFLGKIHENRGEMEKAREYYRRFYEYWKDGDMDRERVEEARKKLES